MAGDATTLECDFDLAIYHLFSANPLSSDITSLQTLENLGAELFRMKAFSFNSLIVDSFNILSCFVGKELLCRLYVLYGRNLSISCIIELGLNFLTSVKLSFQVVDERLRILGAKSTMVEVIQVGAHMLES